MKHISNKNPLISFAGGLFFCFILFASCENFLDGGSIKDEIEQAIAYNNAKEISVLLQPEEGTGSTLPAGNTKIKKGYDFEISFSENPAYSFVKWTAVTNDNARTIVSDGVVFEDATSAVTKVKISNDTVSIRILPVCEKRIEVSGEPSPGYSASGESWNSPIHVEFTKAVNPDSFIFQAAEIPEGAQTKTDDDGNIWAYILDEQTYFKNIIIEDTNGLSLAEYYDMPIVNGTNLTVLASTVHPFEFEKANDLKIIKVTLSTGVSDIKNIRMASEKSWRYQINNSTNEKASVVFANQSEGTINVPSKDYSLGQRINISFKENEGYQFVRWDYDKSILLIDNPDSIETTALVIKATEAEAVTTVKTICVPCLAVTTTYPVNDIGNLSVSKNESIRITFDHELPAEEECREQLENISIKIGSDSVKSNFKEPHIDGKTITIAADNSNLISVDKGETKTVAVTIPATFYYEYEGKKIYAAKDYTWSYKINDTTINKTPVSFSATEEGMSGKQIRVEGTYLSSGTTKEMSVQQKWALEFPVSKGYKFDGWKITVPADYSVTSTTEEQNEYKTSGVISIMAQDSQTQQTQTLFALSIDTESPEKAILYSYGLITEGFTISVMETALPVVEYVKVNAINSIYDTPTTSCDSKIYIHFNKEMNVNEGETILASNGYISITKVGLSTMHYENYFTSSWEDNNTTHIIKPTYEIATLVPNPTDLFYFVLKLNASKEFTDTDNNTLQLSSGINNSFEIGYTITGVRESNPPDWKTHVVYNKASKEGRIELDSTPFDEWNNNRVIYKNNHLGNFLYFSMSGTDDGTGIDHLLVTEKYIKTATGGSVESSPVYAQYEINNVSSSICTFEGIYKFKTVNDGILQIDFNLVDKVGNKSETVTYYVIKDTTISPPEKYFEQTLTIPLNQKRYNSIQVNQEDVSDVLETVQFIAYDYNVPLYKSGNFTFSKTITTKVYWSYDVDYFDEKYGLLKPNKDNYELQHNPCKTTYLKFVFSDDVGNESSYIRFIPARPDFISDSFRLSEGDNSKYVIIPNDLELYKLLAKNYCSVNPYISVLYFRNWNFETNGKGEEWQNTNKDGGFLFEKFEYVGDTIDVSALDPSKDYYYNICIINGKSSLDAVPQMTSIISDTTLLIKFDKEGHIVKKIGSLIGKASNPDSSISNQYPTKLKLKSVSPMPNTKKYRICVDSKLGIDSSYLYKLQAIHVLDKTVFDATENTSTNLFTLDLPSPDTYFMRLVLTHKQKGIVYYTEPLTLVPDSSITNTDDITLSQGWIALSGDCTSPVFNGTSNWSNTFPFAFNIMYNLEYEEVTDPQAGLVIKSESYNSFPVDETAMAQDDNNQREITYWILPNSKTDSVLSHDTFTEEELNGYSDSRKSITYDLSQLEYILPHNTNARQLRVEIPLDDLDEGFYTICLKASDSSGNYSYLFGSLCNKLVNKKMVYSVTNNKIKFEDFGNLTGSKVIGFYYLDAENNKDGAPNRWIYSSLEHMVSLNSPISYPSELNGRWARIVGFESTSNLNFGYYDIEYVYLDYLNKKGTANEIVLYQKNVLPGLNGLQVYCDAPTFAHTLYCSKKLSETATENDIAVWENKGIETGIVVHNSNFTYGNDKYADIPSGYYYTTVIHFADGTKVMSEVKQK